MQVCVYLGVLCIYERDLGCYMCCLIVDVDKVMHHAQTPHALAAVHLHNVHTTHSPPGNMFGLRERLVAIESLLCLANELKHAKGPLTSVLGPSDTHAVEQFFQVWGDVMDAGRCRCCMLYVGCCMLYISATCTRI